MSGDISLIITLLAFPFTVWALYKDNAERRGLRPLIVYIPGGLMMCHYVILGSIKDHTPSQMYLFDSKRAYDFAFYLQILGIIITVLTNMWNASLDHKIRDWAREKCPKCFMEDGSWKDAFAQCCQYVINGCRTPAEVEEAQEQAQASAGQSDETTDADEVEELQEFPPTPAHKPTRSMKERFKGKNSGETDE